MHLVIIRLVLAIVATYMSYGMHVTSASAQTFTPAQIEEYVIQTMREHEVKREAAEVYITAALEWHKANEAAKSDPSNLSALRADFFWKVSLAYLFSMKTVELGEKIKEKTAGARPGTPVPTELVPEFQVFFKRGGMAAVLQAHASAAGVKYRAAEAFQSPECKQMLASCVDKVRAAVDDIKKFGDHMTKVVDLMEGLHLAFATRMTY